MAKISIDGAEVTIVTQNEDDYICLTDMVANQQEGSKLIEKWLTQKSTIEFLGVWESMYNPNFNSPEFGGIKASAGSNTFYMSVKQWIDRTGAIGITAKTGRYGGTYAHKDIAFEFGSYISPLFKLLLIKEFQRLKEDESRRLESGWDVRRFVSKVNYRIQTDAVKDALIPVSKLPVEKRGMIYAEEAEIINFAMFGITSKEWKNKNPDLCLQGRNLRDYANTHELIVLSNLESLNAEMIRRDVKKEQRLETLREVALSQLKSLSASKDVEHLLAESPNKKKDTKASFDQNLKGLLNVPPPKKDGK